MDRIPKLLMIGAAGRNAGKTEFACRVIKRLSREFPVTGVKVTTVDDRTGECARGGEGCGACTSFTGDICVTEERCEEPDKDTSRLLAAGAKKVFWVRVLRESISRAASALKDLSGPDALIVCESNSARLAIDPDLFLVVREKGSSACKPSCQAVLPFADAVIESDGERFSLSPEQVSFSYGHWTFPRDASAIVMAGGDSRRMGRDKALLPIDGEPMISRILRQLKPTFNKVLVSAAKPDAFSFPGIDVVADEAPGAGPLMALVSALEKSETDLNFVMPCDIPDPPPHLIVSLLRAAKEAEIAVPVNDSGQLEPLFAVYRKSVLPSAREALARGARRVISFYDKHVVKQIVLDRETALLNLNTMDDYLARMKR